MICRCSNSQAPNSRRQPTYTVQYMYSNSDLSSTLFDQRGPEPTLENKLENVSDRNVALLFCNFYRVLSLLKCRLQARWNKGSSWVSTNDIERIGTLNIPTASTTLRPLPSSTWRLIVLPVLTHAKVVLQYGSQEVGGGLALL